MVSRRSRGGNRDDEVGGWAYVDERSFHEDGILDSSTCGDPYGGAYHGKKNDQAKARHGSATTRAFPIAQIKPVYPPNETFGPILAVSSTSAVGSINTGGKIVGPPDPAFPGGVRSLEFVFWN
jgi:hypothetical protein